MTPNHPTAAFLFVNKNAKDAHSGSLSRSDGDTSLINRQAQRWTASKSRKRRVVALQTQSASTRRIAQLGWQRRGADIDDEVVSSASAADTPSPKIVPQNELQLYSANFSECDAVDPFASTPVRMTKEIHKLLQYYLSYSILTAFKGEVVCRGHLRQFPGPLPGAIVRRSLTSEVHCYALLTATCSHLNQITTAGHQSESRYMASAIRSLSVYLGSLDIQAGIDPQIVLDILFLSNAERRRQNHEAALMHMRILCQLAKLLDLSSTFGRYVYEMICGADVFLANEAATPPLFELSWDPGVIPRSRKTLVEHELDLALSQRRPDIRRGFLGGESLQYTKIKQRMGTGFTQALEAGLFSPQMRSIVSDLVHTLDMAMYSSMCPSATEADAEWVHRKCIALAHRLLSLEAISRNAQDRDHLVGKLESNSGGLTNCQEECCRLALIMPILHIRSTIARNSITTNATRLQVALSELELSWGLKIADEVLLWILITGLFFTLGCPEEEWFAPKAVHVASRLGLHTFTDLSDFTWRFFHKPHAAHEQCLQRLAASLRRNSVTCSFSSIEETSSNEQDTLVLRFASREPTQPP